MLLCNNSTNLLELCRIMNLFHVATVEEDVINSCRRQIKRYFNNPHTL